MLKEEFIFAISLLGTTIQDGDMKERSVFGSSRVNYAYMASNQNKFILSDLSITVNLSKCEKALCFLYKSKKAPHCSFYKDEWFLDSGVFVYFTSFESNFVNVTLGNYGRVETTNSKAPLFIVTFSTVLIEHEIFDLTKGTTKVVMSKL